MRLISANKLAIVALIVAVLTVVTGVTWAANSNQEQDLRKVELQLDSYKVQQGGTLDAIGAGFEPGEAVLVQIFRMTNGINPIIGGGTANDAGVFQVSTSLPDALEIGVYTVRALVIGGDWVASAPLIVIEAEVVK